MADGDFILSEEDRAKLRERMGQVEDTRRDLTDQRNAIVETDSPDDAAYDLKRSKELGIPRAAVGGDRDGHKVQQKFEELNRLAEEAPKSRRWLAEPDNYAIARDEVKDISLMEKLMAAGSSVMYWGASDFGEALPDVAKASPAKFKQQYYGTLQQQQEMAGAYQRELDAWKARRKPIFSDGQVDIGAFNARLFGQQKKPEAPLALKMVGLGADDSYSELGRKAAMSLLDKDAQQSAYQARKALEEFQAKMPQTGDFVTDSALSGVSSLINMLPMIGMAIATKSPNAPSVLMGGQVQGESYARAREEGLSPLEADQYAGSQAAIEVAMERVGLGVIFKNLEDGAPLVRQFLEGQTTEQVQEQITTVLQDFVDWQTFNPEKTIAEFAAERPEAAAQTAIATLVASGAMQGSIIGADALMTSESDRQARVKNTEAQQRVSKIFDAANRLKTLQRSPEAAVNLLDEITGDTDVETVTIDLDGIGPALEEAGIDPLEALTGLGLDDAALKQAYDLGGEIEVRTSALLTSPLMRDNRAQIEPHVRHNADEYTPAKREAAEAELETEIQNIVAEGRKGLEDAGSSMEADDQVRDLVTQRLQQGGAEYAQQDVANAEIELMTAMNNTLARALGRDPVEFFNERFPDVKASLSEEQGAEVLQQAQTNGYEGQDLEGAQEWEAARAKGLDMSPPARTARRGSWQAEVDTPADIREVVFYHGSDADIKEFWTPLRGKTAGTGVFLTSDIAKAGSYASEQKGKIYPVHVRGKNIVEIDVGGRNWSDIDTNDVVLRYPDGTDDKAIDVFALDANSATTVDELAAAARETGLDGVMFTNVVDSGGNVHLQDSIDYLKSTGLEIPTYPDGSPKLADVPGNLLLAARDHVEAKSRAASDTLVIFDPANIRSVNAAFDPDMVDSANLLSQQARGTFSPTRNLVTLFDQRNASTLMHELSHWYLTELHNMAAAENAPAFVKKQYEEVLRWARVPYDFQMFDENGVITDQGREVQESFAETFEAYLRDGKAPTAALRDAFRVFKRWITAIYRRLTGPERANLTPEIRSVMDRMVASEDAIEAASKPVETLADQQAKAMLDAGIITEKQYDNFRKRIEGARESAKEDLLQVLMQQHLRESENWWRDEKKRVKGDLTREFDRSQVGRAWNWLAGQGWKGDVPDSESTGENEFYQEVPRNLAAMMDLTTEQMGEWYVDNVTETRQELGEGFAIINLQFKSQEGLDRPDAHVNLKLDNGKVSADMYLRGKTNAETSLKEATPAERRERVAEANRVFTRASMVLKHWIALEQPPAVVFSGSSTAHNRLYGYLLSRAVFEGYTNHQISSVIGGATDRDGVIDGDVIVGQSEKFVILKEGQSLDDFADTETEKTRSGRDIDGNPWQGVHARYAREIGPVGDANRSDERGRLPAGRDGSGRGGELYQLTDSAPTFFSALHRFVQTAKQPKAPADQWKAILSKAPGIKAEEIEWTGVNEWLDAQDGSVSRDDLAAFLEQNGVQVEEVVKGGSASEQEAALQRELLPLIEEQQQLSEEMFRRADPATQEQEQRMQELDRLITRIYNKQRALKDDVESDTKWSTWTLPGGENYREMLLTLPQQLPDNLTVNNGGDGYWYVEEVGKEGEGSFGAARSKEAAISSYFVQQGQRPYTSSHWSEPNVVAHVRFKERVTADGQRTLALEEIQSDWHQAGRKRGYKSAEQAQKIKDTQALYNERKAESIRLLRVLVDKYNGGIMERADNVVDSAHRAARLGSESADADIAAYEEAIREQDAAQKDLRGAHMGNDIPNAPFKNNAWTTLALKRMIRWAAENGFDSVSWIPGNVQNGQEVDAEDGRSDFYDKIVPNLANKLGKKYGAKVEKVAVEGAGYKVTLPNGKVLSDDQPTRQSAEAIARNFEGAVVAPAHEFWSLPITPEMREAALEKGFPLFQRGDPKGWGETSPPPDLPPIRLDLSAVREDYGEDAVRRLPRAIRERSGAGSSVTDMLETIRGVRKTLKRKPPKSLSDFIRSKGKQGTISSPGARGPNGIKGSAPELKAMGLENLINETSGMDIDYVREMAAEVGYLEDGATINDLLDALDRESRGDPVYRAEDMARAEDIGNAEAWQSWLSEGGVDIFETNDKVLRKQVSDFVTQNGEGAMSPDDAAELLGFTSGEALLKALAEVGSRERYLNELTRREMNREFGNMMEDGTLEMEARQMAEAELVSRHAEIELEALARAVGEVAAGRMAKQMAKDALALMTVKEIRANGRFLQAERREMRNALDATRKGNYAQAFIHKRRQLVNMHLYNEARKAADKLEKHRRDLQKYETSESRRKSIAPDYREKIDALLEAYELRVSKQGPKEQRSRLSAAQWVLEMTEQGRESEITPEAFLLAQAAEDKVWSTLTLEEAEYLVATVANMAHLGKLKERLLNEREKRAFSAVVDGLVERLVAAPTNKDREQNVSATVGERTATWLRKAHARLTRMEFQFARLDGGENGALFNALWRPMAEAADRETVMARDGAEKMNALYEAYSPRERGRLFSQRVDTPELQWPGKKSPTRMDVITVGLNWGNEGNRSALLEGYGWDEAAVETMLNRVLTDKDWDFIEGTWALIGEYRDPAFALEKKITGVAPKAVEGVTFTLASGREIKGQYYPLKYSTDAPTPKAVTQQRLEEKDMLADLGKTYSKPMTKTGHLKERVGSGGKRVKLSISVFHEHVQNVIHDINYRPAVIDAHKIIQNERFAQAYINAAGREQYDMLRPWIAAVATERAEEPGGFVTDIMQRARRNFSIVAMGYKIGTATQQLTGILAAPALIGTKYTTQGFLKAFGGNPASFWGSWQWVSEKSEFMRDRPQGFDRDVRMVTNKMQERTPLGKMQRNAFIFIGMMDTAVSTGAWIGAYDKAMDGNVKGIEAGNEEDAIVYADSVIRRTQVAGRMQDLPQIMRGTELEKLMTSVYSYFSGLYNLTAAQIQDVRGGQVHPAAFAANMSLLFVVIPMLAEVLAGRFPPPDDEDEPGEKAAKALVSNAVSTVPFLRDIVNAGMNPQFGYNMSPAGSIIDRGVQGVARAADGIESEYEARLALDSLGVLFGLPTGQLWITGEYAYGVATGEEDPSENPADALREAALKDTR